MYRLLLLLPLTLSIACYDYGEVLGDDDDGFAVVDDDDDGADDDDAAPNDDDASPDDDDAAPDDDDVAPDDDDVAPDDDDVAPDDADGDGWPVGQDCDDSDPAIHPGSTQQLDGVDSDCDGALDWLVQVWISGDDDFEWCWDDEEAMVPGDNPWTQGQLYEVWMPSGSHVVGVRGWDLGQVITAVIVHVELSDGTSWVSDASWTFDPEPEADAENRAGWCNPNFDDSGWQSVNVIGPIGTSPWGSAPALFPAGSPAMWIWDYYPVNLNTQYVRKQIELP
jgi:hypothetical protein